MPPPRRYLDYLKAAFNARPAGMFVAPNWIGVGIFGLLGILNSGFWLLGAGLEAAYLFTLANSPRFRRAVDAAEGVVEPAEGYRRQVAALRASLPPHDNERYGDFAAKCRHTAHLLPDNTALHSTLAHVSWLFLQLLNSRNTVSRLQETAREEDREEGTLEQRLREVEARLETCAPDDDLCRTLGSTRDILRERLQTARDSRRKLGHLDAELSRLEEQVRLLHDRAQLDRDTPGISRSLDEVTAGISGATAWMSREKELLGDLGGSLDEPPPAAFFETES